MNYLEINSLRYSANREPILPFGHKRNTGKVLSVILMIGTTKHTSCLLGLIILVFGKVLSRMLTQGNHINITFTVLRALGDKGDPYAHFWELKPLTASITWGTFHEWKDDEWMKKRAKHNALNSPWSVYEVHLASWIRPDKTMNTDIIPIRK